MSTLNVSNITDGTTTVGTSYVVNGSAKVWVSWDGTGTIAIRDSLNASSLADNGTGNYTVTWSSGFDVADSYTVVTGPMRYNPGNANWDMYEDYNTARTATAVRVFTNQSGTSWDSAFCQMTIHGELA